MGSNDSGPCHAPGTMMNSAFEEAILGAYWG